MNLLAIDTSTECIVLALENNGKQFFYIGEKNCKYHNKELLKAIDNLLTSNNLEISDIDVFGVTVGPGSFTGIRIGVATVNAFSLALNKKIVEVTSLEQEHNGKEKIVLLDCKHDNFYVAFFGNGDTNYASMNKNEIENISLEKVYFTDSNPKKLLSKCIEKTNLNKYVEQAKPFYIKKSSAERI